MWGRLSNYYLFSFFCGVVLSKINACYLYLPIYNNCKILLIVQSMVLPAGLLAIAILCFHYKSYTTETHICIILMFILGCNTYLSCNLENISINIESVKNIRKYLLDKTSIFPDNTVPYIKTFLLGDKSGITQEQREMFVKTGTLHIFSLSGLHAGIVYSTFYYILIPIKFLYNKIKIHFMLSYSALIAYTIITGCSVSVVRATIMIGAYSMFRFVLIKNSKLSTLMITAFIITLISPDSMFKPSFQLSFMAMGGIFYIYPYIKSCIDRYKIIFPVKYILNIVALSLSCQISTLPVSLYYFNEISPIFLLGNMIIVPLITMLIYISLIYITISPFEILSSNIYFLIDYLTNSLNFIINFLGKS